jgi:hypothetical protein
VLGHTGPGVVRRQEQAEKTVPDGVEAADDGTSHDGFPLFASGTSPF